MPKQLWRLLCLFALLGMALPHRTWAADSNPAHPDSSQVGPYQEILIAPNPHLSKDQDVRIQFDMRQATFRFCEIDIYNIAGEWVRAIKDADMITETTSGTYPIRVATWDTKNHRGENIASGVYLVNFLIADELDGKIETTEKLVIIR